MTLYREMLLEVLEACKNYREKKLSIGDFHHQVYKAELSLVSLEDKEIREFFMLMENEIDYIRVMNNEPDFMYNAEIEETDVFTEILPLVIRIENECKKELNVSNKISLGSLKDSEG